MYLQGELTEEKEEYIASERARIMSIIASETEMKRKHDAGEITDAEYGEYMEERYLADMLRPALEKIETQLAYIKQRISFTIRVFCAYSSSRPTSFCSRCSSLRCAGSGRTNSQAVCTA